MVNKLKGLTSFLVHLLDFANVAREILTGQVYSLAGVKWEGSPEPDFIADFISWVFNPLGKNLLCL